MAVVVLYDMVHRPPPRSLISKCVTISRYECKCDSIYARGKGMAPPAQIFVELAKCEQYYV